MPVDGEAATLDADLRALGQGDIPQQGQGGAGLAHGIVHGFVDGGEIEGLLPCRDAGHDGIAAGAGVVIVCGRGVVLVGNHIDIPLGLIRGGGSVGVHHVGTRLVIGQGIALGQQVDQVARLAGQSRPVCRKAAILKYAAGNLHAALLCLDDGGIVGSALDGELGAVADDRTRAGVMDSRTASVDAVEEGDVGIAGDNQNRRCAAGRPPVRAEIDREGAGINDEVIAAHISQQRDDGIFYLAGVVNGIPQGAVIGHAPPGGDADRSHPAARTLVGAIKDMILVVAEGNRLVGLPCLIRIEKVLLAVECAKGKGGIFRQGLPQRALGVVEELVADTMDDAIAEDVFSGIGDDRQAIESAVRRTDDAARQFNCAAVNNDSIGQTGEGAAAHDQLAVRRFGIVSLYPDRAETIGMDAAAGDGEGSLPHVDSSFIIGADAAGDAGIFHREVAAGIEHNPLRADGMAVQIQGEAGMILYIVGILKLHVAQELDGDIGRSLGIIKRQLQGGIEIPCFTVSIGDDRAGLEHLAVAQAANAGVGVDLEAAILLVAAIEAAGAGVRIDRHLMAGVIHHVNGAAGLGGGSVFAAIGDGGGIDVHQLGTCLVIGEGLALGQEVMEERDRAGLVDGGQGTALSTGISEDAAGNFEGGTSSSEYIGVVGTAKDNHLADAHDFHSGHLGAGIGILQAALAGERDGFLTLHHQGAHVRRAGQDVAVPVQGQVIAVQGAGAAKDVAAQVNIPQELQGGAGIIGGIRPGFLEVGIVLLDAFRNEPHHICHAAFTFAIHKGMGVVNDGQGFGGFVRRTGIEDGAVRPGKGLALRQEGQQGHSLRPDAPEGAAVQLDLDRVSGLQVEGIVPPCPTGEAAAIDDQVTPVACLHDASDVDIFQFDICHAGEVQGDSLAPERMEGAVFQGEGIASFCYQARGAQGMAAQIEGEAIFDGDGVGSVRVVVVCQEQEGGIRTVSRRVQRFVDVRIEGHSSVRSGELADIELQAAGGASAGFSIQLCVQAVLSFSAVVADMAADAGVVLVEDVIVHGVPLDGDIIYGATFDILTIIIYGLDIRLAEQPVGRSTVRGVEETVIGNHHAAEGLEGRVIRGIPEFNGIIASAGEPHAAAFLYILHQRIHFAAFYGQAAAALHLGKGKGAALQIHIAEHGYHLTVPIDGLDRAAIDPQHSAGLHGGQRQAARAAGAGIANLQDMVRLHSKGCGELVAVQIQVGYGTGDRTQVEVIVTIEADGFGSG